jgi:hypothetical protein
MLGTRPLRDLARRRTRGRGCETSCRYVIAAGGRTLAALLDNVRKVLTMSVKQRQPSGAGSVKTQEDLAKHLVSLVSSRVLDPLDILLGDLGKLRPRLDSQARAWAATLLGDDDESARFLAIRLVCALYPSDRRFEPPADWWGTPLGRVVAWRAGHPWAEAVSYSIAGAMLGITRQGVHDLVQRGKLERDAAGGVRTASVRARLARLSEGVRG